MDAPVNNWMDDGCTDGWMDGESDGVWRNR